MQRGYTYFKCPACGKVFKGPDIELNATVETMPLPCPECGTSSPAYERGLLLDFFDWIRKKKK